MTGESVDLRQRLLVVEDDPDVCENVRLLLEEEGFEVEVASDGAEALDILRARPSFDLILLDLMLPKTDGWQFRVAQRADPVLSAIPVLVMSASTSAKARAIDADAYVPKPFDPEALTNAVRQVLERRRHADLDRLTSLGRMAAGIAHEVNNPLTYIYASLSLVRSTIAAARAKSRREPEELASDLASIDASIDRAMEGVDRVRSIMNGVRLFIRAPDERRGPVDVRDVIEHTLSVLGHEVRQKAQLDKHLEEVPILWANAGQLGDLFVNLVTNALDSIPAGDPQAHVLTVRTSRSKRGEIVIDVEDTGSGIADDVRSKIFEPFFSTKAPGLGTGLGLSICLGIVRSQGGSIEVETRPGRGSCVRVRLPAERSSAGAEPVPVAKKVRVLIVDDDERVANALARLLEQEYETMVAGGAGEAFRLVAQGARKPDVILCDFFLGDTSGQDLYERLRQTRPELADRMIFMTGAAFTEGSRRFLDGITNPCLDKPFATGDFKKAVELLPWRTKGASRTQLRAPSIEEEENFRAGGRTPNR
jgi:signal transduction histidine kinase